MGTITVRRSEREELERQQRRHEEERARLTPEQRRQVAEQRLVAISRMFE
jgi:hypothetical protein